MVATVTVVFLRVHSNHRRSPMESKRPAMVGFRPDDPTYAVWQRVRGTCHATNANAAFASLVHKWDAGCQHVLRDDPELLRRYLDGQLSAEEWKRFVIARDASKHSVPAELTI
jgi:hypothetical protein